MLTRAKVEALVISSPITVTWIHYHQLICHWKFVQLILLQAANWSHMLLMGHCLNVSLALYHLNQLWPATEDSTHLSSCLLHCERNGLHIAGSTSWLIAAVLTSASWNSGGEVSKELPAECRACVLVYEVRVLDRALASVVYFQRGVLRMCWEVEELRGLSALQFRFHLPSLPLLGLGEKGGGGGWGARLSYCI